MFQNFTVLSTPETGRERVERLRARFDALSVDAILIPRADEFQGEYVPPSATRLAWISGFTGSAGAALVTRDAAFIFVDGRYTAQVRIQSDMDVFTPLDLIALPPSGWIEANATDGMRIGYDPRLHTLGEVERFEKAAAAAGAVLVPLEENPIDSVWDDRPAEPRGKVMIQPERYAGRSAAEKIAEVQQAVARARADVFIMTDPSSIAWTFNIRGADVPHTPHPLARAIVPAVSKPRLFIHAAKLGEEERAYLAELAEIDEPDNFDAALKSLGENGKRTLLDPALTPQHFLTLIGKGNVVHGQDPARLPRATKNAIELEGSANAHRIDGAAMVRFLAWLDAQPAGSVTEIKAAEKLESVRLENGEKHQMPLRDISFETIAGSGPHGAINHYRVNEQTNRRLEEGELFLIDSGGQYVSGTTDITRTVPIGTPTAEMRRFFTLVLKGMIAVSLARFPEGTRGVDLDPLARIALWKAGADYGHGTGHGVGSYLAVHEGPASISKRGTQALLPGMILSNEPGYYRDDAFGIRIENLIIVHEPREIEGGDRPMLGFETLTLCPIDRRLIDIALLTPEERQWLDDYHARVARELMPLIEDQAVQAWLKEACAPLG
jgi:Xaa-Pro aminopeptidase